MRYFFLLAHSWGTRKKERKRDQVRQFCGNFAHLKRRANDVSPLFLFYNDTRHGAKNDDIRKKSELSTAGTTQDV